MLDICSQDWKESQKTEETGVDQPSINTTVSSAAPWNINLVNELPLPGRSNGRFLAKNLQFSICLLTGEFLSLNEKGS
ncbi:hypothetical protein AV530_005905 [Patagioenas fasciata monilis]|uniref:Uncharacterized protein n=1 Tax=Patagioenas fasciata monilis TaxID=372326 RepID=A0A1V4JN40_PATFA|nr:hypothetical protein AV530_005905 [Patagioenas fasciata monilis]